MANWRNRISYDDEPNWSDYGPRIYLDRRVIGTIDIADVDPREDCDEFRMEDCPYVYLEGEGDTSIPNGWHEWWDCEAGEDCPLLNEWIEALVADLKDPENVLEICDDCDTEEEVIASFEDCVPDYWHFKFVRE